MQVWLQDEDAIVAVYRHGQEQTISRSQVEYVRETYDLKGSTYGIALGTTDGDRLHLRKYTTRAERDRALLAIAQRFGLTRRSPTSPYWISAGSDR